ncbi:hypothetical protein FALCPG4_007536 [Fusarium falciforme]
MHIPRDDARPGSSSHFANKPLDSCMDMLQFGTVLGIRVIRLKSKLYGNKIP